MKFLSPSRCSLCHISLCLPIKGRSMSWQHFRESKLRHLTPVSLANTKSFIQRKGGWRNNSLPPLWLLNVRCYYSASLLLSYNNAMYNVAFTAVWTEARRMSKIAWLRIAARQFEPRYSWQFYGSNTEPLISTVARVNEIQHLRWNQHHINNHGRTVPTGAYVVQFPFTLTSS